MRRISTLLSIALLTACAAKPPLPLTPAGEATEAPVVRRQLATPPAAQAPASRPSLADTNPITIPADALYVCVTERAGERRQAAIEFAPKVAALCKRHPEMGPCQYERELCRRSGGRVYAANGQEITPRTEDEYDRRVLRVRFRAN